MRTLLLTAVTCLLFTTGMSLGASTDNEDGPWPGFRGANRDGKSTDKGLLKAWPAGGPKLLWQATGLGEGFSNVTVGKDAVYITGAVGGRLILFAFNHKGKLKWKKDHGPAWTRNYPGARANPTLSRGHLYLLSGKGKIACYKAEDGSEVWTKTMGEFGGHPGGWGFAESVLIARKLAVVAPGGRNCVVGMEKYSGKVLWKSPGNGAPAHYGSCILVWYKKIPMVVATNGGGIFAVHPKDGHVMWTHDFSARNTANCPTPAYADGYLFWATGYGKGGICFKLEASGKNVKAREVWRSRDMVCHHGGYIIHEGYIYGNNGGGWSCLKLETGEKKWSGRGVGKGSLCYADGMLYLFGERGGKVGLAKASPEGLEMTGAFSVKGKAQSWANPVVADKRLYIRYHDNLYCFDVKK